LSKTAPKLPRFWPQNLLEEKSQNFGTNVIQPNIGWKMWQSLVAIERLSSEIRQQKKRNASETKVHSKNYHFWRTKMERGYQIFSSPL